ncbi:hypothetical protein SDRG_11072 [Saprolegnia diclina VS20]|uniref:C3H1-type domain-containing protein n=2 Tax=Saprolegnia diclina (strain VS20) TaxID=1156394 RepID=T0RFS8_SAPDV|nr:hypothetical protein SDRG_11072 [Saprolegnia diclina VS20]EQC31143.1 hypothetical protein SDRG_11072 [Saprolegnia diclina VS20]|eukprot:XP_008615317.1 hypothetical protein SDRG_11072 [Saprolegnia diclina VS20]
MALETKASLATLAQAQYQGFTQLLQTFDGRVHEHETLLGVSPMTGKACGKRKRTENGKPMYTTARPVNSQETTLLAICDKDCILLEGPNCIPDFMALFASAKTEPDQAKLLHVLEATAKKGTPHAAAVVAAFESTGGMKTAKAWLEAAVAFNQTTFLHLVLTVLKALPVTLASITEARINEPIVALRKSPPNDVVKRSAQDLLKSWRTKFTEKPAPPAKGNSSPPSKQSSPTSAAATPVAAAPAVSARVPTKSNTLLTNLLMKPKETKITKAKDTTLTKMLQQKQLKDKEGVSAAASSPIGKGLALPAIVSFGDVKTTDAPAVTSKKRIRWADNHGKDLTQVKLIESWRDIVYHTEADDELAPPPAAAPHHDSFKDAKLREHANEKHAFQHKHTERLAPIKPTMEWRTPLVIQLPHDVAGRVADHTTNETTAQAARTRKDVEWILLGNEVPPSTPHEWTRSSADVFLGPAARIALADGSPEDHRHDVYAPVMAADTATVASVLSTLEKTTVALLLDNEHVLAQVYDEVLRTRRRISDARICEIVEASRSTQGYHHHNSYSTESSSRNPSTYVEFGAKKRGYDGGYSEPAGYAAKRHQPAAPMYSPPPSSYASETDAAFGRSAPTTDRPRYRKVPCKHYRTPRGCKKGDGCPFVHEGAPSHMQTGGRPSAFDNAYGRGGYGNQARPTNGGRGY